MNNMPTLKISIKALFWSWLYIALIFVIDFLSKAWVIENIPLMSWQHLSYPYGGIPVFHDFFGIDFSLNYVQNRGGAWGLFSNYQWPLFIIRSILVLALINYQMYFLKEQRYSFPITMVVAGALSNLLDTVKYGFVIDMFHFNLWGYSFPVFNVADISICVGVGLLILFSLKEGKSSHAT